MKGRRRTLLIGCFFIIDILLVVGILFVCSATLTITLEREVTSLASLDFYEDRFNTKVKSSGNYGKVEKAIKIYLDDYALRVQSLLDSIDYERLNEFSSINYLTSVSFDDDLLYLDSVKKEFNNNIDFLINEDSDDLYKYVYNYIDGSYFVNLYSRLIDEKIIIVINNNKNDLRFKKSSVNAYIDSVYNYINFLKVNSGAYSVVNGDIQFYNIDLEVEYFNLIEKIKESKI